MTVTKVAWKENHTIRKNMYFTYYKTLVGIEIKKLLFT